MSLVYEGRVYKLKYTGKQRICWSESKHILVIATDSTIRMLASMQTRRNAADLVDVTHSRQEPTTATYARKSSGALSDDRKGEQQLVVAPPGCGNATKTPSAWRAKRRTERTKLRSVGDSPNQISKQIARDDRMVLLGVHAGYPPCR
ncbi:hypothetical protein T12_13444 [Trichinella patagoniensis]|uniref:Uncharacterized protein n=1 Tax=Trichinella patagoniensis TaxID=990121 RepID=A0A0V0Z729_9BILA|nr:hypothetical protein T12_13444 [Trichinella patagoniensis]